MPTIAIDYTPAYEQGGGIGRYVRELVAALAREDSYTPYRLFVAGTQATSLPPSPNTNFIWKPTRFSPRWLARIWQRAQLPIPVEFFTGKVDLFHATDFVLPPTRPSTKTLLTVHDLSFVRTPETASPPLKAYLDKVVPRSIQRANHVLADSQATKDDLLNLYHVPVEKITVLLSGVEERFLPITDKEVLLRTRNKYGIGSRPYILAVGTIQPRKNFARLIQALAQLRMRGYDLSLVIAGGHGWLESPIYETIRATNLQDYVYMIGFVDDPDLPALYSAARCLAFPSLYEGFGFPVLEAMACGTPVVTSTVSSLPEVAGDAALMVDPQDLDAITVAIQRLIEDDTLRNHLIPKGLERVKSFTWANSAHQLRQIYAKFV